MGFLAGEDEAVMWRGLMLNRAVQHFLEEVAWGDIDYLVVDMPPGTGDIQMGLARMLPSAEVLVVTTPAQAAQKVAARAASMARKSYLRVVGVVENMSCLHLRARRALRAVRQRRRPTPGRRDRRAAARQHPPGALPWPGAATGESQLLCDDEHRGRYGLRRPGRGRPRTLPGAGDDHLLGPPARGAGSGGRASCTGQLIGAFTLQRRTDAATRPPARVE